jgi:hypothetical protein
MPRPAPAQSSTQATPFVSGLAWSFIGLAGLSMLLALIPSLLFAYVVPMEPLRATVAEAIRLKMLPPLAMTAVGHLPALFMALFAGSLLTLLVSIGLLQRKNWARIAFAWIMVVTAAIHLAGLALPFYLRHDFSAAINHMPPDLRGVATTVTGLLVVASSVMGIVFAGFFAWVAQRLFSAEMAREFLAHDKPASS